MKYLFIFFLLITFHLSFSQTSSVKVIIQRMLKSSEVLGTAKFTLYTEERMKTDKFVRTERFVKILAKPKEIYFYSVNPNPGTEILWKEGWNNNKMMVSPGSFPFITFSMNPNSSIARKDSHHSIRDLGFDYVMDMIGYYLNFYGDRFYNYISIADTVQWDNHSCIRVAFDFKDYTEINYTVKKKENVIDIAEKFHLNDYSILMMNPSIDGFDNVRAGQVIKIPNFYCRKIEFYIDKVSWLPLRQLISDQNGLYEKYEMKSFQLNPVFKTDEFSPEFGEYKF